MLRKILQEQLEGQRKLTGDALGEIGGAGGLERRPSEE